MYYTGKGDQLPRFTLWLGISQGFGALALMLAAVLSAILT
jgi:hypothetical protein